MRELKLDTQLLLDPVFQEVQVLEKTDDVQRPHHVLGIRYHGASYIKHFMGPIPILVPFMLLIEIISNFARLLSLSMRLFGNIMAKETLLSVLFMLAGAYFAPLPILCLGVLVSLIQALVFTLLSVLYCAQAMEEAH